MMNLIALNRLLLKQWKSCQNPGLVGKFAKEVVILCLLNLDVSLFNRSQHCWFIYHIVMIMIAIVIW